MAAAQAGRGGKGATRKVNPNAGKGNRVALYPGTIDQFKQGQQKRNQAATRGAAQRKRDAVKRGAEGPKRRSR
jgi:hypothetical protein